MYIPDHRGSELIKHILVCSHLIRMSIPQVRFDKTNQTKTALEILPLLMPHACGIIFKMMELVLKFDRL